MAKIGIFVEIPLAELAAPQQGYVVMLDYFWLVGPKGGALVYEEKSLLPVSRARRYPQANTQEMFGKMMLAKGHGGAVDYQKVPLAYWPPGRD